MVGKGGRALDARRSTTRGCAANYLDVRRAPYNIRGMGEKNHFALALAALATVRRVHEKRALGSQTETDIREEVDALEAIGVALRSGYDEAQAWDGARAKVRAYQERYRLVDISYSFHLALSPPNGNSIYCCLRNGGASGATELEAFVAATNDLDKVEARREA